MRWTKERPTKPGFYFARFAKIRSQPFVVEAREPDKVCACVGRLNIWQGPFLLADLGDGENIEFAGPIPLPED